MRKILYYPTIAIPSEWLKYTILYWDQINSIMPKDWEDLMEDDISRMGMRKKNKLAARLSENDISAYGIMKLLKDEGEYAPIRPELDYLPIRDEFEDIIGSTSFKKQINNFDTKIHGLARGDLSVYPYNAFYACYNPQNDIGIIHKDKISGDIIDLLIKYHLARRHDDDSNWYIVEGHTSFLYLALLAKHLAYRESREREYTVIGTDWNEYETLIFNPIDRYKSIPSISANLFDILPVPRADVSIENILKFKKKHNVDLFNFRSILDDFQKDLSESENEIEIQHTIVKYQEKIKVGRDSLRKSFKESDIKSTISSFKSLMDIKSPALLESLGGLVLGYSVADMLPILGVTALIQIGLAMIDKRNEQAVKASQSPYSYLYYAEKEKITEESKIK